MFRNYLNIAIRNLKKRKGFTFINMLSLALGITGGIFMLVYILDEISFDRFHTNADRIFRVNTVFVDTKTGHEAYNETNGWPVGKILEDEFPEVEAMVYTITWPRLEVHMEGQNFNQRMAYVGEKMLDVFSFELLKGNPSTALSSPYQVVITEDMEAKFFPGQSALNQTLMMADTIPMMVTGVLENVPQNSHMQFDILLSFATYEALVGFDYNDGWGNINMRNYLLLKEGVDQEAFKAKAQNIYMDRVGDMMKSWGTEALLYFEPLGDIYLRSRSGNGMGPLGSIERVYLVFGICLLTILLACINFINLSTARSVDRSKEVGLRKVVGSSRRSLIYQFLMEALVLTILAFLLALSLSEIMMPLFNELLNKNYSLQILLQPHIALGVLLLLVAIAFLAGYYPALNLSGMEPIRVLKGRFITSRSGVQLRKVLVVFQFFISVSLVLGTFIVLDQLNFMQQKELGFAKDELLVLSAGKVPKSQIESFKAELGNVGGVREVTFANGLPGRPGWIGQIAYPEGREEENPVSVEYLAVDENYIGTLGLEVLAGRAFDPNRLTDLDEGLVLNEKAVTLFGWTTPEEALGQRILSPSGTPQGVVIGVVKDYHQLGLQQQIHGIAMDVAPQYSHMLMLRFDPAQTSAVLEQVNQKWLASFPAIEYSYFFLNEDFERLYQAEQRLSKIFTLFAGLTLLISVIGLFGLVSYMIESRTKELGVRKVLGAGTGQIVRLLSKEFVVLIAMAGLMAIPVVYYFGQAWLENFAYRTPIKAVSFAVAVLAAFVITFCTVSLQALRAARANTVTALRSE